MRSQATDHQVSPDDFEAWQKGYVTTAVVGTLKKHASETKIELLQSFWETDDPDEVQAILKLKEALRSRIDVILDLDEMGYEDFISYFKTE